MILSRQSFWQKVRIWTDGEMTGVTGGARKARGSGPLVHTCPQSGPSRHRQKSAPSLCDEHCHLTCLVPLIQSKSFVYASRKVLRAVVVCPSKGCPTTQKCLALSSSKSAPVDASSTCTTQSLHSICASTISLLPKTPGSLSWLPPEAIQSIINADGAPRLTKMDVAATSGANCETLPLEEAVGVTSSWATHLNKCPLETIDLTSSPSSAEVSDEFMTQLLHWVDGADPPCVCTTLDTLAFRSCRGLTNKGFPYVSLLPQLVVLQIPHAEITAEALQDTLCCLPRCVLVFLMDIEIIFVCFLAGCSPSP